MLSCNNFNEPLRTACNLGNNIITEIMNTIVQIFSKDIPIYKFSGCKSYLIDNIEVENDGIKAKWSIL